MSSPSASSKQRSSVLVEADGNEPLRYPDAVDALEVAARLEIAGLNDRLASDRHGRDNIFALASDVFLPAMPGSMAASTSQREWRELCDHILGAITLILACVMAGVIQAASDLTMTTLLVMSAFRWVGSQSICSGVWARKDIIGQARATRVGIQATAFIGSIALLILGAAVVMQPRLLVPAMVTLLWYLITVGIGINAVLGARVWSLITVAGAVVVASVHAFLPPGPSQVIAVVVLAGLAALLWVPAAQVARSPGVARSQSTGHARQSLIDGPFVRGAGLGFMNSAVLALSLIILILSAPAPMVLPMVLGSIAVVATAEPLLVIFRQRIRSARMRSRALRSFRRIVMLEVLAGGVTVVLLSGATSVIAAEILGREPLVWSSIVMAAIYSVVSVSCVSLNAFGAPATAAVVSFFSLGVLLQLVPGEAHLASWLFAAVALPCVAIVGYVIADPRASA